MLFRRFRFTTALLFCFCMHGQAADPIPATTIDSEDEAFKAENEVDAVATPAAGEKEYWEAILKLNNNDDSSLEEGRKLLLSAAEKEFPPAQNLLGGCYTEGTYGFSKKPRKAADYFQLAAERGYAFAQVNMGRCYLAGIGVWKNKDKALYWLELATAETTSFEESPPPDWYIEEIQKTFESAEPSGQVGIPQAPSDVASNMLAHYLIALIYETKENKTTAQEHHLKSAYAGINNAFGIPEAATYAAINYALGTGVERNLQEASRLLERSQSLTEQRYSLFASNLPSTSLSNRFTRAKYTEFYNQVAKEQKENLQYFFATAIETDEADYHEAAKWYEIAANQSQSAWAMLNLAFFYHDGKLGENQEAMVAHWFKRAAEEGNHHLGESNYALCLYHGIGVPQDRAAAMEIFDEFKESDITSYLASIGHVAENIQTYDQKVEINKHWAKKEKDPTAQYLYGRRFKYGWGVNQTYVGANKYFKKAAKQGHAKATYELGLSYNSGYQYGVNYPKALHYFETAFRLNYMPAGAFLAYYAENRNLLSHKFLIESGPTSLDSLEQAIFFYRQAIDSDPSDAISWNNLGLIYKKEAVATFKTEDPEPHLKHRNLAVECFQHAADEDNRFGYYNLGLLYYEGELIETDFTKAYRYFFKAYELDHNLSAYYLGQMHWNGQGIDQSTEEAIHYFRITATNRSLEIPKRREALHALSNYYLGFQGESADINAAQYWLMEYAKLGNIDAANKFGDLLLNKKEYKLARKHFKRVRKFDITKIASHAYYRLSQLYRNGLGGKSNLTLAEKYLNKAIELNDPLALCDQGNQAHIQNDFQAAFRYWNLASNNSSAEAAYNLGCYYYAGTTCPKDANKAQELFRKSSALGNPQATFALALLGYNEIPDAPSLEEALELAKKALNWGHPKAQDLIDKIQKKLDQKKGPDNEHSRGTGRVDLA